MEHLGDITTISGYNAPVVDCIIGGSPCQDLSVAGKRAGLAGERSGLFMEQVRIVKEMRERDRATGRTGNLIRPRFVVWENVPGALSSNHGEDFRAVLDEIVKIADKSAVIPRPEKWQTSGCILGDGYSVAWRILDAQFWGVPQRRRRIALVADFGGQSAPEILFERKGVSWDTAASGETGQGVAGAVGDSVNPAVARSLTARHDGSPCIDCGPTIVVQDVAHTIKAKANMDFREDSETLILSFSAGQGAKAGGIGLAEEVAPSLKAADSGTNRTPVICIPINDKATRCNGGGETRRGDGAGNGLGVGHDGDPSPTLTACDRHGVAVFDARGNGDKSCVSTLTGDHQNRVTDYTAIVLGNHNNNTYQDKTGTLTPGAHAGSYNGQDAYNDMLPCDGFSVRRLTPLECERLQGYPDGWTDIGTWVDSRGKIHKESSDSARYKALGNSIALPPWKWVLKRLCACYERDATMASLFDGIGGFPLIWERLNGQGSCLWASEIEEFPMAVTRYHFK